MLSTAHAVTHLGFLTVLHEPAGYVGGYLVTNLWGRPLEFRLSTSVQPNRVQQILYGGTLQRYLCSELIGSALVAKTTTEAHVVFTDTAAALDLRLQLKVPVALLATQSERPASIHPDFPADLPIIRETIDRIQPHLDLAEPFARIREAIAEARKMGVTSRG